MTEVFTLSWDDFNKKCPKAFKDLWLDTDLSDVTLATEEGRVEKSKNEINSCGYCFLVAFWYVETRKNICFGQRKFFVRWNLT